MKIVPMKNKPDDQERLSVEEEMRLYRKEQERALGLDQEDNRHWFEPVPRRFPEKERAGTTLLFGGFTVVHDDLIEGALQGLGYKVKRLDCPDQEALRLGKEFGNRGQCNPAYFTVGNLIKYLYRLRDTEGIPEEDIIRDYVFITSGSCGPCRFGTYATEYRKALRDAGFPGFRVLLFQQNDVLKQAAGGESALKLDPPFFMSLLKAILLGDILNILAYRIRPYELEPGATDAAITRCRQYIHDALSRRERLRPALVRSRRELGAVRVDCTRVKPKVSIIGEFWAMTTEGEGNYRLQRFLEEEGAEVEVQPVAAWILFLIWEGRFDTLRRLFLREADSGKRGLKGKRPFLRLIMLRLADRYVRAVFRYYARAAGLRRYPLPNMEEVAGVAHAHYNNHLRGGEGHMEVGKLILNITKRKANMTISVKPFGCMPSSGVSDGVQSFITGQYPDAVFLPIETTGDGAVNVYSRVQMMLFKAKQAAEREFGEALSVKGLAAEQLEEIRSSPSVGRPLQAYPHVVACTAANIVYGIRRRRVRLSFTPKEMQKV